MRLFRQLRIGEVAAPRTVVTGRFGFKTYDVSNPEKPALLDEFMPAGIDPVAIGTMRIPS